MSALPPEALAAVTRALGCAEGELTDIKPIPGGMTNRSVLLTCRGERYILRVPGEGTGRLISRRREAQVYAAIAGRGLCDDPIWLDAESGYKLTRFLDGARGCDAENAGELRRCVEKLRALHGMALTVEHTFDPFERLLYYESLRGGAPSVYADQDRTKRNVLSLRPYIEAHAAEKCLCHIDAVPDNFLFYPLPGGGEGLQLTDWEYAGMQDPHIDLAMFCIYAMYDRPRTDRLIDLYFENACPTAIRAKIYAYMAVCGLLWSEWCEYKRQLGVQFDAYAERQYRYAREYYALAKRVMEEADGCTE